MRGVEIELTLRVYGVPIPPVWRLGTALNGCWERKENPPLPQVHWLVGAVELMFATVDCGMYHRTDF